MQRILLYEDAYGYTALRLYSHAFMLKLGVVCLLFLAALLSDRRQWLTFSTLFSLLVGLASLGALSPDRLMAEQNLQRYALGRPLDATHLTTLSADAAPIVLRAYDLATARGDETLRAALGSGLHRRLVLLDEASQAPWTSHNLARAAAHAALSPRRAELEAHSLPRSGRSFR